MKTNHYFSETPALLILLLFSSFLCMPSFARIVEDWSYERLVTESDLVAIVEPLENQPAKNQPTLETFPWLPYHPEIHFVASNTRFRVHAVLKSKGDAPK